MNKRLSVLLVLIILMIAVPVQAQDAPRQVVITLAGEGAERIALDYQIAAWWAGWDTGSFGMTWNEVPAGCDPMLYSCERTMALWLEYPASCDDPFDALVRLHQMLILFVPERWGHMRGYIPQEAACNG